MLLVLLQLKLNTAEFAPYPLLLQKVHHLLGGCLHYRGEALADFQDLPDLRRDSVLFHVDALFNEDVS